ncbi:GNAT family N-acetyltransferase [Paenibacillus aestuarii]|uniref:GNAT family N-acetyltransferase n=1 Tax=Paenibacillus aestuarii TaxID=516965 RepID=A0ABW0KET8_9BACL|nr:GNAT family N-acetyltransferase [Paenibacillus aestuarii]
MKLSTITIRFMQENDPAKVSEAFLAQGWNKPAEQYVRYVEEQKLGRHVTLVAEAEGDFAGYVNIIWEPDYPLFKEQGIPEIQDFNVLIRYRRQGIGTLLMDRAEELIRQRSAQAGIRVGLFSDYGPAQAMYVKRGYIPDGRGIYQNGEYMKYGQQVVVDDDLILALVKTWA